MNLQTRIDTFNKTHRAKAKYEKDNYFFGENIRIVYDAGLYFPIEYPFPLKNKTEKDVEDLFNLDFWKNK